MDSSGYGKIGDAVVTLVYGLMALAVITVPLAIWKLVELAMWLWAHVSISWGAQ